MSKKLQNNGLWESSRMMLPEHRARILEEAGRDDKRPRPLLHEDELEEMLRYILISEHDGLPIQIELFTERGPAHRAEGTVTAISQHQRKFRVDTQDGFEWIDFAELLTARLL